MTEQSTQGIKTVLHPVSDLAAAKAVYTALLGAEPDHDSSYYVGYEAAGQHIGRAFGDQPVRRAHSGWRCTQADPQCGDACGARDEPVGLSRLGAKPARGLGREG